MKNKIIVDLMAQEIRANVELSDESFLNTFERISELKVDAVFSNESIQRELVLMGILTEIGTVSTCLENMGFVQILDVVFRDGSVGDINHKEIYVSELGRDFIYKVKREIYKLKFGVSKYS